MQNKYNPILFACLIAVGIFIGQKISNKDQVRINDKINSIIQLINSHYVDTLNNNFEEEIINSIIKDLDPHTSYISKKSYKTVEEIQEEIIEHPTKYTAWFKIALPLLKSYLSKVKN